MVAERTTLQTLRQLSAALAGGAITSRELVAACLARATDVDGEGARVFLQLDAAGALQQAEAMDELRRRGAPPSAFCGIPISVKDLFDVRGQITRAGSKLLAQAAPAAADCPAVARLRRAGLVLIGRTNMTEFAFSGVGINPHYDTPRNPFDRATGRIPGGSSSGAAVSVTDGMAAAAIGTDTGGSCRIPAALCGISGFKPTASRVPREGVYPLAPSLDSVGPLAASVQCCAILDDLLAGGTGQPAAFRHLTGLRLAVLDNYVTADLDPQVAQAYERALGRLQSAGVHLVSIELPELARLPELNSAGGIAAAEAFAHHRTQIGAHPEVYDPRVGGRIARGASQSAADYIQLLAQRKSMIDGFERAMQGFDALLSPTLPIVAPPLDAFTADEDYVRLNLLLLRNPSVFNFLDGCAISIPIQEPGTAPVGLTLAGTGGSDRSLLAVAAAVQAALASGRRTDRDSGTAVP
ncbi:MAG: amidase [Pseudomonadales bacterium]